MVEAKNLPPTKKLTNSIDSYVELSLMELGEQSAQAASTGAAGASRPQSRGSASGTSAHANTSHASGLGTINLSSWSLGSLRDSSALGPAALFGPGGAPPGRPGPSERKGAAKFGQIADVDSEDENGAAACRTTVQVRKGWIEH